MSGFRNRSKEERSGPGSECNPGVWMTILDALYRWTQDKVRRARALSGLRLANYRATLRPRIIHASRSSVRAQQVARTIRNYMKNKQKNSDGLIPGSGSREGISALPAPSEPYVRVSPHTAQASASIIEVPRGGRPGRHHRWTRTGEVVAVTGSRRLSVMIPCSSRASSAKIDPQAPQRPSCCFSSRTRWTRAVSRSKRCLRRSSQ
jgi:hypothetical protein